MANLEHEQLSSFIKNVHMKLRINSKKFGFDLAWQDHCKNDKILQEYALSMHKLATEHWDENVTKNKKVISRITWIYHNSCRYFGEDIFLRRNKELKIQEIILELSDTNYINLKNFDLLNVLDVGSCYNPFSEFKNFNVTAIDIAPACENVYKCDFLNVNVSEETIFNNKCITHLKRESFHIIIFSLFLEYIPTSINRLQCCKKAYDLLDYEGLLIIITPDSKHVGANAKLMKSWRYTLSLIGFSRIKYEKLPYLHCMMFRKSISNSVTIRWAKIHESEGLSNAIHIPQDFNINEEPDETLEGII